MRLLDRYLLRELMIPLGYCLSGFLIFWVSFDLLGEVDTFRRLNLGPGDVGLYYLMRVPELLVTVLPVGLLLALLYALTHHARHQELTAARAAGVSLTRLCLPYFVVGAVFALLVFWINEVWVPRSSMAANRILTQRGGQLKNPGEGRWTRDLTLHNDRDRRLWNIGLYDRQTGTMWLPNVEWWEPGGARHRIAAAQAIYTNRSWVFLEARELHFNPGATPEWRLGETNALTMRGWIETPERIESEIVFGQMDNIEAAKRAQIPLRLIRNYQRLHPELPPERRASLRTQFHGRLAEPWTCLVVVLIAIPFGTLPGRRNVFVGVAASLFIAFAYFVVLRFSLALGTAGYLPPWLAAWLPNVAFGTAGILLTRRVR